jgi:general secretion pathway protein G
VELLVVIGIIAVLIGILMLVLSKARAQANRAVCLSNIRQLGTAILMYCNDNKGWFPTCAAPEDIGYRPYPEDWVHWQANRNLMDSAIAKYVGRGQTLKNLLWCPADTLDGRKAPPGIAPGQGPYLYSYGMNAAVGSNDRSGSAVRTKIAQWRAPSRKILLTELWDRFPGSTWHYSVPLTRRHGTGRFRGNVPGNPDLSNGAKIGVNVSAAFLDGHADSIDFHTSFNEIHVRPEAR